MRSRYAGGWGRARMAPKAQEQHEQRPRGHADGQPCSSIGCEGKSWGTSSEREGGAHVEGPKGSTLGCKLYSSDCGGRRVRNRCFALPPYPPPTLQDHVLAVPASH